MFEFLLLNLVLISKHERKVFNDKTYLAIRDSLLSFAAEHVLTDVQVL